MKRRVNCGMVVLVLVAGMASTALADDEFTGSGTEGDPYQIGTAEHLQSLSKYSDYWDPNIYFKQIDDIIIPPGMTIDPIGNATTMFAGIFDGAGHTISGLNQSGSDYLGLFGYTTSSARISNLSITAATINGLSNIGILAGRNYGSISHCSATGEVTGDSFLGGLVGYNRDGTISNCYATGAVTGESEYLGGLVGSNVFATISHCYATGAVNGRNVVESLGGLVGYIYDATISNCYATGAVNSGDNSWCLGGLVGRGYNSTISNCYATGAVTAGVGSGGLGGLVGENRSDISNCYATGAVTAGIGSGDLGGLVGYYDSGNINNCYWDINTTGQTTSPGGGTGKTTEKMKQEVTFTDSGWNFTDTWLIIESKSYPYQIISAGPTPPILGDLNGDGKVNLLDWAIFCQHWLEGTS
ncbi:GLUG motif-containing protein [Planctomycetota bacterium]